MRWAIYFCLVILSACQTPKSAQNATLYLQPDQVQLGTPKISLDSVLFKTSTELSLDFGLADAEIYYTLDNSTPIKYNQSFTIDQTRSVKAQARKAGYQASEWVEKTVVKINNKLQGAKVQLQPKAHENYPSTGARALIDAQKGSLNFRADQTWSGFQAPEINIQLDFQKAEQVQKIYVSLLSDHNSWIFLPQKIEVWQQGQLLGSTPLAYPKKALPPTLKMIPVLVPRNQYQALEIKIVNHLAIPKWHAGKGTLPWLFIDEIFIE